MIIGVYCREVSVPSGHGEPQVHKLWYVEARGVGTERSKRIGHPTEEQARKAFFKALKRRSLG